MVLQGQVSSPGRKARLHLLRNQYHWLHFHASSVVNRKTIWEYQGNFSTLAHCALTNQCLDNGLHPSSISNLPRPHRNSQQPSTGINVPGPARLHSNDGRSTTLCL